MSSEPSLLSCFTFRPAILLSGLLLLCTAVLAQTTISTGSIQGTVTDPSGAVVNGARVTISNKETGQSVAITTSSAGAYSSGALLPGDYVIRVEQQGFSTTELNVGVQVGVTTPGNIKLGVGKGTEVVEVTGTAVTVNTEQPSVQGVLTSQQIEKLPINGRNFLDLAQLEPGVQIQDGGNFDPTKNGFSSISFGGRYGRTARIELDGIDISDETVGTTTQNISAGAIDEFQLSQSTLDLSTELTSSGAVNVATKSGTNTYHGEAFYLFRDASQAANFPTGINPDGYQRNHFGGSFGGPLWKNKLYFFVNAERIKQDLIVPLAPAPPFQNLPAGYPSPFKDTMTLSRLDWQIKPNMHLFYRFTYEWNGDTKAFGATYQPFINRDNTPAHGVGLDFSTGGFQHSIRFGYLKFQNGIVDAVAGNPGVFWPARGIANIAIRIGPAGVVTRFGPSRLAPQETFQSNKQIKYDGSKLLGGNHILRYGFAYNKILGGGFAAFYGIAGEARNSNTAAEQAFAATGPFPGGESNPLNYRVTSMLLGNGQGFFTEIPQFGFPAGGQFDSRLGIYIGDSWKIKPNLTLTYGVRYSRDTGRQDSDLPPMTCDQIDAAAFGGQVPCTGNALMLDQFGAGLGKRVRQPNTNFGPQFGFAWDPARNGRTVIRGGAGLYWENGVFNNILFDRPGRLPKGLFFGTASPCSSGSLALPTGPVSSVDGLDIATQICGQRIGTVATAIQDMESLFAAATKQAGASLNGNFLGENLANGGNSTGNNFIAPDFRTPRSIQMNIGIQREIRPGLVVTADLIRNVGLRYLLAYDTNHVGDSRYLNMNAALNAINATLPSGCTPTTGPGASAQAAVNCYLANTSAPTMEDFAGNGLTSGINYLSGFPASLFGLTPDTGAAFAGINPLVGENQMLFPIGRSTYTGLQTKLVYNKGAISSFLRNTNLQFTYAYSHFNTMTLDQDFVNNAYDFRDPGRFYGPGSLDRRHQISFGGSFDFPHGPRLSLVMHFASPLPSDMLITDQARNGEPFYIDALGDGQTTSFAASNKLLPGTNVGDFGRRVNGSDINKLISQYNSTVAGTILPAGQALIDAGLMTQAQLVALGAVADSVPLAPAGEVGMTWLRGTDMKFSWPIKIRERFSIEPSVGIFNIFNFANFNAAGATLTNVLDGSAGSINGTTKDCGTATATCPGGRDSVRTGLGTGVNAVGAPRQIEWGLRFVF
jgi:Carboxypeptidase regulatory-like domain